MMDRTHVRAVAAGVACSLLSVALGSSALLWSLSMYWMLGATAVAFNFAAAARALLDSPGMYPRSMKALARAAEDRKQSAVYRRTAVALYLYMVSLTFCAAVFCTIPLVALVFFRK